jgi:hypothetical protein
VPGANDTLPEECGVADEDVEANDRSEGEADALRSADRRATGVTDADNDAGLRSADGCGVIGLDTAGDATAAAAVANTTSCSSTAASQALSASADPAVVPAAAGSILAALQSAS